MCHILSVKHLFTVVGEGDRGIDLSTQETDKTTRGLCKHKQLELHCQPPWLSSLSSVSGWTFFSEKNSPSVLYKAETTFYSSTETPLRPWRRTCTCRDTKRESTHLSIHSQAFFLYVQQNILIRKQKDPLWPHRTAWGIKKKINELIIPECYIIYESTRIVYYTGAV